jgi:hypothetical protein
MGEVKLSTGKIVKLDMSKVKFGEWRNFFRGNGSVKEDDTFVEKITGLKPKEQADMLRDDYRRIMQAIIKEGNQPLADLNLAEASTSE